MFFYKCKLLRVYDSSLPIRVYLISTSLLKLTSLTTLHVTSQQQQQQPLPSQSSVFVFSTPLTT